MTKPKTSPNHLTDWLDPKRVMNTGYGLLTSAEWLLKEAARLNTSRGRAQCQVITNSGGHVALYDNDPMIPKEHNYAK